VTVKSDSPYKTAKELSDAIKAAPARQVQGVRHRPRRHLAPGARRLDAGARPPPNQVAWVPSNGAAPAMQDLAAGGIDVVTCSVPEARAMIDAGRAKSLA
jgi:tripartite-type tricarboxylate transporter receptor subunit TctC